MLNVCIIKHCEKLITYTASLELEECTEQETFL